MKPYAGLFLALLLSACRSGPDGVPLADIARNNEAVGLMGQYRNEEARLIFAELAARHPALPLLRSNEAIATLNRQTEGDEERALAIAEEILQAHPGHPPAHYVAGLASLYLGRVEQALPYLLTVSKADPDDAHAAYFAAQSLSQLGRSDEALTLYRQAIEADPYLGSAYYAAALVLRRRGDGDEARALLADYQRLQGNPRATLAEFRYTRMGDKATAQVLGEAAEAPPSPPDGPIFARPERIVELPPGPAEALLTADIDGDGRQDLLYLGSGEARILMAVNQGYQTASLPDGFTSDIRSAAWGDLDNDGRLDLALCAGGGISLWTVDQDGTLAARSDKLPDEAAMPCRDIQLFDADHDGDLDIFLIGGPGEASDLLNNNLDGSWRALAAETPALRGPDAGLLQLLVVDMDADRDLDLIFLDADGRVFWQRNDRLWNYQQQTPDPAWQKAWQAMSAIDPEARGRTQLVLIDAQGRPWLGDPDSGELAPLALAKAQPPAQAVSVFDADGDGREELLFRHAQGLSLLAMSAAGDWQVRWEHKGDVSAVLAVLEDPAQGPSLVFAETRGGETELWRVAPGPGRQKFVALAPIGRSAGSEGTRSNASGIGTQLRLRRGAYWTLADLLDRDSGPGQSLQPLALGVGDAAFADFVELQWSDGVMQTELGLAAGKLHRIEETQRQLASCPVLFAWDGQRFRFVSDVLGVGGIGFLLSPGQYAEPRPWEYFRLPDGLPALRDGEYRLKIAEPMEEAAYLDHVSLHVYDLPPGWALVLDERMHTGGGPAPSGKPLFFRPMHSPGLRSIRDQQGVDQSARLAAADFDAVDPGPRDPRFLGRLQAEQVLVIELAEPLAAGVDYALVGDGWVEYPYSQTLFAAWQAGADYRSYSLDLGDGQDGWRQAYAQFGYPAGMPREFALPLPNLDTPVAALRLRGNLEVYLDRLSVVRIEDAPKDLRHHVVSPSWARLERVGYPRRAVHDAKRPDYDFDQRSPFWDTRYPEGLYTNFGPVEALLEAVDDGLAIVGPGDALDLAFRAPPPLEGYSRVLVLEVRGYAKDMDLYTRDGGTLGPLPRTPGLTDTQRAKGEALNRRFNQRFQAGK